MGPLSGQNEAKWRRSKGALSYRLQQSDKDPAVLANWQTVAITASVRHIVQGLEPFKPYWYCVSAIGFAGEGKPSAPIMGRSA